jgi:hypothetical protein
LTFMVGAWRWRIAGGAKKPAARAQDMVTMEDEQDSRIRRGVSNIAGLDIQSLACPLHQ